MTAFLYCLFIFCATSLECSSLPLQNITFEIYSDLDDWVVGNLYPNGAFAVASQNNYTRTKEPYGLRIWESAYPYDRNQQLTCYIGKSFNVPGSPILAKITLVADDKSFVNLNNVSTGCSTAGWLNLKTCDVTQFIVSGLNTLNITVINGAGSGSNIGSLNYRLSITTSVRAIDLV